MRDRRDLDRIIQIHASKIDPAAGPVEIVERKGVGHPDTLSDALAEHLSVTYSRYTLEQHGTILRHQFDKTAIMCGRTKVAFGDAQIVEPIRVLLNGRASARLGATEIPLRQLLVEATRDFFRVRFPMLDPVRDFRILFEVRHGLHSTTGGIYGEGADADAAIHYRFDPRTLADLPETHRAESNDTSLGCAWAPLTPLERLVLGIEKTLNAGETKRELPWLGSDIKIMAARTGTEVSLVVAAPILALVTKDAEEYFARVNELDNRIRGLAAKLAPAYTLTHLVVNSGDDLQGRKLYMNLTGSSIESGDEGMVGRGNRLGGVIAPFRPYTMEGIAGKNPRYHVGKVYSAAAYDIARRLHEELGLSTNVYLINRMAKPLSQPWYAVVETTSIGADRSAITAVAHGVLSDLEAITHRLLAAAYPLF